MLHWIRRGSRLFAGAVFFLVFVSVLLSSGTLSFETAAAALIYASGSAVLCWFAGFVICDMVIKNMVATIEDTSTGEVIDGGLLQRVKMMQDECVPGGSEMPFSGTVKKNSSDARKSEKEKTPEKSGA